MSTKINTQLLGDKGAVVTLESVDDTAGNRAANLGGNLMYLFENTGASAAVVTITVQKTSKVDPAYGELDKANSVINLSAGDKAMAGPFPKVAYNDGNGEVDVQFSGAGAADVEIAAIEAPKVS